MTTWLCVKFSNKINKQTGIYLLKKSKKNVGSPLSKYGTFVLSFHVTSYVVYKYFKRKDSYP